MSQPTPVQRLPFVGHALNLCNACLSLVTAYTNATLAFHWSKLTSMQRFPFIGLSIHPRQRLPFISYGLHLCNTCLSLVTAYTYATLAFHWSRPTPTQCLPFSGHAFHLQNTCFWDRFVDFNYCWMYLSTTSPGSIADQGDILQ